MTCPDCDNEFVGRSCACGYLMPRDAPAMPDYMPERVLPTPETMSAFRQAARGFGYTGGRWWTPERVRNQQQVNFIILQAQRFGPGSMAGRFLAECRAAGVIVDNKLGAA